MADENRRRCVRQGSGRKISLSGQRTCGGGGQLELRMEVSPDHPDPDVRGVARRVKFFNLESWHKEWTEVARRKTRISRLASNRTIANRPLLIGALPRHRLLSPCRGLHAGYRAAYAADI